MLVLTRKLNERIVIGDNIRITVVEIRGHSVRIGFEAPPEVGILREELRHSDAQAPAAPAAETAEACKPAMV